MEIKRPFLFGTFCILIGCLLMTAFFYTIYGRNALRVRKPSGVVDTIRWPYAYTYSEGDQIEIPNEDGTVCPAIVTDIVTVTNNYTDDREPLLP